jgi:hypothetical protein
MDNYAVYTTGAGYEHDVFVSYAHLDDEPPPGADEGWITTLVRHLEQKIAQKLGYTGFRTWIDHDLAENARVTPTLINTVRKSATMIIFMSPGYANSAWCQKEMQAFHQAIQSRAMSGSEVFVIHQDEIAREDIPEALRDLTGFQFWTKHGRWDAPRRLADPLPNPGDPSDGEYFDLVVKVAHRISAELKRIRGLIATIRLPGKIDPVKQESIFLAAVPSDLNDKRHEVQNFLEQQGYIVLPKGDDLVLDSVSPEAGLRRAIAGCKLYVQLLSGLAGKPFPGTPKRYPVLQYEAALAEGKVIKQWRSPNLDLEEVEDADHRRLVEGEFVNAWPLNDFMVDVLKEARREEAPVPEPKADDDVLVFVNVDQKVDAELADHVCQCLRQEGVGYEKPVQAGDPEAAAAGFKKKLESCDGYLVLYGHTDPEWVADQLRLSRKVLAGRKEKLNAKAVLDGPPSAKAPLSIELPAFHALNARNGSLKEVLAKFLQSLRKPALQA